MSRDYFLQSSPKGVPADVSDACARLKRLAVACRDILADGQVSFEEITALRQWITEAGWLCKYWPASGLRARLINGTDHGDPELIRLLEHVAGLENEEEDPRVTSDDEIEFAGKLFVFSGIFYFGTRQRCSEAVVALGGETRQTVSGSTDYIVVGGISHPRWLTPEAGTKLEKAISLRSVYDEAVAKELKRQNKLLSAGKPYRPSKSMPPKGPEIVLERTFVESWQKYNS